MVSSNADLRSIEKVSEKCLPSPRQKSTLILITFIYLYSKTHYGKDETFFYPSVSHFNFPFVHYRIYNNNNNPMCRVKRHLGYRKWAKEQLVLMALELIKWFTLSWVACSVRDRRGKFSRLESLFDFFKKFFFTPKFFEESKCVIYLTFVKSFLIAGHCWVIYCSGLLSGVSFRSRMENTIGFASARGEVSPMPLPKIGPKVAHTKGPHREAINRSLSA